MIVTRIACSFSHDCSDAPLTLVVVQWGPHLEMFKWRVANFPDRLANLYFTFLFVLRAAMKVRCRCFSRGRVRCHMVIGSRWALYPCQPVCGKPPPRLPLLCPLSSFLLP